MRTGIVIAGLSGAMAVSMAAWAMHGMAGDPAAQELIHKGAYYQLTHALALLAATQLQARLAVFLFIVGLVLFPGCLYLLALGVPLWASISTPLGGTAFIAGWLALTYHGVKHLD